LQQPWIAVLGNDISALLTVVVKGQAEILEYLTILIEHGTRNAQAGVQGLRCLMGCGLELVDEREEALQAPSIVMCHDGLRHRASHEQMVSVHYKANRRDDTRAS